MVLHLVLFCVKTQPRPKFGFAPKDVAGLQAFLQVDGEPVTARPRSCEAPDPDDPPSFEAAVQAAAILVNRNTAH